MRRLKSALGLTLALLYLAAFAYAYHDYLGRAGHWFADAGLLALALPYTLTIRAAFGSADLSGDNIPALAAAAAFCAALAYVAGAIVEAAARALIGALRRR